MFCTHSTTRAPHLLATDPASSFIVYTPNGRMDNVVHATNNDTLCIQIGRITGLYRMTFTNKRRSVVKSTHTDDVAMLNVYTCTKSINTPWKPFMVQRTETPEVRFVPVSSMFIQPSVASDPVGRRDEEEITHVYGIH